MKNNNLIDSGFILSSSWMEGESSQFSGMAYLDDSIIIGLDGYRKYSSRIGQPDFYSMREGRFGLVQVVNDQVLARTDCLGQETLFYFFDGKNWAISSSFIGLASHVSDRGVSLTANAEVISIWGIRSAVTQGLVSNETFIKEIRVLPADSILRISKTESGYSLQEERDSIYVGFGATTSEEYQASLISFASKMASRSYALLNSYGERVKVDITGGQDSRLVLGVLAASGYPLDKLNFHSNRRYTEDYKAAEGLANALGFRIQNRYINTDRISAERAYQFWRLGCVGVYSPVYPPLGGEMQSSLHFHGACGECFRDFYKVSGAGLALQLGRVSPGDGVTLAFIRQLSKAIDEMRRDFYSNRAMVSHYRNFRSRSHFGRSSYKNLSHVLVTPLASLDLFSAYQYLDSASVENSQLALDVLLLTCPELATLPFDNSSKSFKREAFEKSVFFDRSFSRIELNSSIEVFRGEKDLVVDSGVENDSFRSRFIRAIEESREQAVATGFFVSDDVDRAIEKVLSGDRLTTDGIDASYIISVSEVSKLSIFKNNEVFSYKNNKKEEEDISVSVQVSGGVVYALMVGGASGGYEYAFYVMNGNERVGVSWYRKEPYFEFSLDKSLFTSKPSVIGFRRRPSDHSSKISRRAFFTV